MTDQLRRDPESQHPDTPRRTSVEEELSDSTQPQMDELGHPDLDEELGADDVAEIDDDSSPGQNSDWLPQ